MIVLGWMLFVGFASFLGAFPVVSHPTLKWNDRQPIPPIRGRKGRSRTVVLNKDNKVNSTMIVVFWMVLIAGTMWKGYKYPPGGTQLEVGKEDPGEPMQL